MATLKSLHLKVVGDQTIHCGGCENTIKFALRDLTGVQKVDASFKTQKIDVLYNPEALNRNQIESELEGLGYQVEEVRQ